jgi:hypothetical protein
VSGAVLARESQALEEQRKKENELTWAVESAAQFDRVLAERRVEDAKAPRETEGVEFRNFADGQLADYTAKAPSPRAAQIFRRHALTAVNNGYEAALHSGERTRLTNADVSNTKAAANIAGAFSAVSAVEGPDVAAEHISPLVKLQLASIEERFGKSAPALASKMRMNVVEEVSLATAASNPDYAKSVINSASITEESKMLLRDRVDSIHSASLAVDRARFVRSNELLLDAAIKSGNTVGKVSDGHFQALFGKNWKIAAEDFETKRTIVNTANRSLTALGEGANPMTQVKEVERVERSGTAAEQLALPAMRSAVHASAVLADKDPVAWQLKHNPNIRDGAAFIDVLLDDAKPSARAALARQSMALQGHAPPGDPHPERYLGRDRTHILSVSEADRRKIEINEATPDKKLSLLADLEAEFGDPILANQAYADMLELGKEKLSVAYRFTGIINDTNTKKEFVNAQTQAANLAKLSTEQAKEFTEVLNKDGGDWQKFAMSWYGESLEGTKDIVDAEAALLAYARHISVKQGMQPADAMKAAVQRVITDNYGFANVNSRPISIGRHRLSGGPDRTDAEIADIGRRLGVGLREVPVREIALTNPQTGLPYYPAIPAGLDMDKPESAQILRDIITSTAFWEMDPSGEMLTLMIAAPKRDGFAVLDKNHQKLTVLLDEIPDYRTMVPMMGTPGGTVTAVEHPKKSYPLTEGGGWFDYLGFGSNVRTNWPVRPTWMGGRR